MYITHIWIYMLCSMYRHEPGIWCSFARSRSFSITLTSSCVCVANQLNLDTTPTVCRRSCRCKRTLCHGIVVVDDYDNDGGGGGFSRPVYAVFFSLRFFFFFMCCVFSSLFFIHTYTQCRCCCFSFWLAWRHTFDYEKYAQAAHECILV